MYYIRLFLLALMLCMAGFPGHPALADGAVLFVSPSRVVVPPAEKVTILSVTNKSDEPRRYDLALIDQVMSADGATQRVETFPYSAKRMLKFVPKRFTLQPGEQQTVRVQINRPKDLADGDYHSHLLFREVPTTVKDKAKLEAEQQAALKQKKTLSFEIRTLYGLGVPVVIQQGNIASALSLGDLKLGLTPEGRRQMSVDVLHTGNAEAVSLLKMDYVQAGKPPVPAITPQWVRIYREIDKVSKDIPLDLPAAAAGGKIVVTLSKTEVEDNETIRKEVALN